MKQEDIKVIVIDDEEMVRINIGDALEDEGFMVKTAATSEDALKLVRNEQFTVAIVDMRLPGIDGNRFILEASRIQPELRCLIHTGSMSYSLPGELIKLGMSDESVFIKPIYDIGILTRAILRAAGQENN